MSGMTSFDVAGRPTRSYEPAPDARGPGVIVLHAWWGLNEDVRAYSDRLAEAGFAVLAPDLYRGPVATTVEEAERLSDGMDQSDADAIALAGVDRLVSRLGPDARIGTVGFSLGAAWALWLAAEREAVGGSVVYYGSLSGPALARARVPVVAHFAEDDPYEPDADVAAFEETLRLAGRTAEIHRYPGTGHWFAEPSRDAYRPDAANLALERTIEFLRRTLAPVR